MGKDKKIKGETLIAINVVNLTKLYRTKNHIIKAVNSLNFAVEKGEIFALVGPNGAGKTTTIKIILNLILPTSGYVVNNGFKMGAVLEGTRNIYMRLTPLENLYYFGALRGVSFSQLKKKAGELIEKYELTEKKDSTSQELSRGMQQKVAMMVALIHGPDLLILDEPTLGLDVVSSEHIKKEIINLKKQGITIILTSHQLELVEEIADRIGIIIDGELKELDTPHNLKKKFTSEFIYQIDLISPHFGAIQKIFGANSIITKDNDIIHIKLSLSDYRELYPLIIKLAQLEVNILKIDRIEWSLKNIYLKLLEDNDD